jgi:hypothetical protein
MKFTTIQMEQFLGRPVTALLSEQPFSQWSFEKSFEGEIKNPRFDYVFPRNGLDVVCDMNEIIRTIFMYYGDDRVFEEGLADLPVSLSQSEVRAYLGAPSKSGGLIVDPILGSIGPWDRFATPEASIHIEYNADADSIKKVTLMQQRVTP